MPSIASAAAVCKNSEIKEIQIANDISPDYDIMIKMTPSGGTPGWYRVRHATMGHNGVDRIFKMAMSSILAGRNMYICYDGAEVTKVFFK